MKNKESLREVNENTNTRELALSSVTAKLEAEIDQEEVTNNDEFTLTQAMRAPEKASSPAQPLPEARVAGSRIPFLITFVFALAFAGFSAFQWQMDSKLASRISMFENASSPVAGQQERALLQELKNKLTLTEKHLAKVDESVRALGAQLAAANANHVKKSKATTVASQKSKKKGRTVVMVDFTH